MKSGRTRSYSGPHFLAFGLNIQSECGIRTRITPNTDSFYTIFYTESTQGHLLSLYVRLPSMRTFYFIQSFRKILEKTEKVLKLSQIYMKNTAWKFAVFEFFLECILLRLDLIRRFTSKKLRIRTLLTQRKFTWLQWSRKKISKTWHCVKSVRIRCYTVPYFPARENTDRITPNTDTFHAVWRKLIAVTLFPNFAERSSFVGLFQDIPYIQKIFKLVVGD